MFTDDTCQEATKQDTRLAKALQRFPLCLLHNRRIVDELPDGCPFWDANPLVDIRELLDGAWTTPYSPSTADRIAICQSCVSTLSAHPQFRELRCHA